MTEQEKQEIIAEVKASVMDEHRCVCKPIILRRYPNFFNYILYKCAQCGAEIMTDAEHQSVNYCSACGCKLDWSGEDGKMKMEMCKRAIRANVCPEDCDMCAWDTKGGVSYENH